MDELAPQRAGGREWIGLAVLALACVLYAMDLTVLHLAVPSLSATLQPTSAQLLWIIDIYGFMVAGSLITMGTLGDRIGRRRLLLIGAGMFGVVSVVAALSTSANMLIASPTITTTTAPMTLCQRKATFVNAAAHATDPIPAIRPMKAPFAVARGTATASMKTPRIEP